MSYPPPTPPSGWPPPEVAPGAPLEYPPPPPHPDGGTNGKAIWSLVCALVGLVIGGVILGGVAITLALLARDELRAAPGRQSGDGLVKAGIVIGCIDIVAGVTLAFFVFS